jgi:hypothetical protein
MAVINYDVREFGFLAIHGTISQSPSDMILQRSILPDWINKGDRNVLRLEIWNELLVIITFSVQRNNSSDDDTLSRTQRGEPSRKLKQLHLRMEPEQRTGIAF